MPSEEQVLEALRTLRGYSGLKLSSSLPADIVPALLLLLIANGGGGSGDASAVNQLTQITRLTEIRDRTIPSYLITPDDHTNNQAVVKTSAGAVYAISCFNASSSLAFFQIHDKATAPVNGDVPIKSIPVFPNGATVFGSDIFGAAGVPCSVGIAWAFSSTRSTLTLAVGSEKTSWVGWL